MGLRSYQAAMGNIMKVVAEDDLESFINIYQGMDVSDLELAQIMPLGVNACDVTFIPVMRRAAECDSAAVLQWCIEQGGNVNIHQIKGCELQKGTHLGHALYYRANKSALALVNAGVDLSFVNSEGRNMLEEAKYRQAGDDVIKAIAQKSELLSKTDKQKPSKPAFK